MYEYFPPHRPQKAMRLILILAIAGAVCFGFGFGWQTMKFRWSLQLIGMSFWTAAILIYTRYVAKRYAYGITKNADGSADFVVTEHQRTRRLTVCRLSLTGIDKIVALKKGDQEAKKALWRSCRKEERKIYDYSGEWMPSIKYFVLAEECGERFAVGIDADETLLSYLSSSTSERSEGDQ